MEPQRKKGSTPNRGAGKRTRQRPPSDEVIFIQVKQSLDHCQTILDKILSKDFVIHFWPFYNKLKVPVKNQPLPNDVLEKPMCFAIIQNKMNNNIYRSGLEFASDIRLIFTNSIDYFPFHHYIRLITHHSSTLLEAYLAEIPYVHQVMPQRLYQPVVSLPDEIDSDTEAFAEPVSRLIRVQMWCGDFLESIYNNIENGGYFVLDESETVTQFSKMCSILNEKSQQLSAATQPRPPTPKMEETSMVSPIMPQPALPPPLSQVLSKLSSTLTKEKTPSSKAGPGPSKSLQLPSMPSTSMPLTPSMSASSLPAPSKMANPSMAALIMSQRALPPPLSKVLSKLSSTLTKEKELIRQLSRTSSSKAGSSKSLQLPPMPSASLAAPSLAAPSMPKPSKPKPSMPKPSMSKPSVPAPSLPAPSESIQNSIRQALLKAALLPPSRVATPLLPKSVVPSSQQILTSVPPSTMASSPKSPKKRTNERHSSTSSSCSSASSGSGSTATSSSGSSATSTSSLCANCTNCRHNASSSSSDSSSCCSTSSKSKTTKRK